MAKLFVIEASVHKELENGYRVKVSLPELGMYINGMMVFPPTEDHEDWGVFTPAQRAGRGKYVHLVEFNKKLPLWEHVFDACVDAVKAELSITQKDVVPEDIPDTISFDNIPY